MSLKVTVDEDLPRQAVQILREHGYDAATVIEQGMGGWKDPQLWVAVQSEERFLALRIKGLEILAFTDLESTSAFYFCDLMRMGFVQ